ncbi:MAG: LysR family transcriptional regulator [Planctomycetes bacterium]|nr:LysR family transcriptional regulator [Planctomycetota bacterium]
MDTEILRNFLIVAQTGNMTRAAAQLHVTQPALSAQLKRLEHELGATLFHRQGRGLELTASGETYRRHASDALETLAAGRAALGSLGALATGTVAIGGGATSTTCLLPGIIKQFHRRHPGIRFTIREAPSRTIVEAVLAGELDLGLVTLPVPPHLAGARLAIEPWLADELVLLVPREHPLAARRRFQWRDLHGQPLIAFESGSAVRQLLDRQLAEHGVAPSVVMELRSIATITSMVAAGIGLGFVSHLADGAGRGLRASDQALSRQLALIERKDRQRSSALAAFRSALVSFKPRAR